MFENFFEIQMAILKQVKKVVNSVNLKIKDQGEKLY